GRVAAGGHHAVHLVLVPAPGPPAVHPRLAVGAVQQGDQPRGSLGPAEFGVRVGRSQARAVPPAGPTPTRPRTGTTQQHRGLEPDLSGGVVSTLRGRVSFDDHQFSLESGGRDERCALTVTVRRARTEPGGGFLAENLRKTGRVDGYGWRSAEGAGTC